MFEDATLAKSENHSEAGVWLIRCLIAINFVRFALSFSSRFEGDSETSGLADQLFSVRLGGFRADFIWLGLTTIAIFLATFYFFLSRNMYPHRKLDAFACLAWVAAFSVFVARAFFTGIIDFG